MKDQTQGAPIPSTPQDEADETKDADGFGKSLILVQRSKEGDEQALNELLTRYQSRVRRIVRIKMGAKVRTNFESIDMVQETLATAAQKLGSFEMKEPAALIRWLAVIAQNRIMNAAEYVNAGKRDPSMQVPWATGDSEDSGAPEAAGETPSPQERAMKQELEMRMDEAVAELPEDWREVILLREFEGGSWPYIAEQMNRSVQAVEGLHRRACGALAVSMRDHGDNPE